MKEPQRLLKDASTPGIARSMLLAGRARREPEGSQDRVWSAVAVGLAGGAAASTGAAAATTTTKAAGVASSVAALKLVTIGVALAVVVAGVAIVSVATKREEHAVVPVMTAAAVTPAPSVIAPDVPPEVVAEPTTPSASPSSARAAPRPPSKPKPSALAEEASLLHEARAALGRGDVEGARAALDTARVRFKGGQLAEEREALEIRVASAGGDRARAATLAEAFVEHHPDSTLRTGIESFLEKKE